MRYLIRAVKYLIYFMLFFFIIVALVWGFTLKNDGISFIEVFNEGSLPQLAIFFVAIAAVYPALGFTKKSIYLDGDYSEYDTLIKETMQRMGYTLEEESSDILKFRAAKGSLRLTRMWEDRITFTISGNPVICEGIRKDLDRIVRSINYEISQLKEDDNT